MVSLSSKDLQRTYFTENVSQFSYLRLLTKFQGVGIIVVENEERENGFTIFKGFTENVFHRERKSVFLPTSINQVSGTWYNSSRE